MNNFVSKYLLNVINKNHLYKHTVVISDALKNIILKQQNIKSEKIIVAHDGADEVLDFDSNAELQGTTNSLNIGYVGSLYKGKGMEVIKMIASKVKKDIKFHIIGGSENDITFWKSQIKSNNVYFYGFVSQSEISSYINSMDICLLPNQKLIYTYGSDKYGTNISDFTSPLKMFEYMSHKKAIIASNLPVLREVLNEENSILVDCESAQEWINAIKKLKNSKTREKLENNALNTFRKNYSWISRAKYIIKGNKI